MYTVHIHVHVCVSFCVVHFMYTTVTHIAHAATVFRMCYKIEVGCRDDTMPRMEGATRYRIESLLQPPPYSLVFGL